MISVSDRDRHLGSDTSKMVTDITRNVHINHVLLHTIIRKTRKFINKLEVFFDMSVPCELKSKICHNNFIKCIFLRVVELDCVSHF